MVRGGKAGPDLAVLGTDVVCQGWRQDARDECGMLGMDVECQEQMRNTKDKLMLDMCSAV